MLRSLDPGFGDLEFKGFRVKGFRVLGFRVSGFRVLGFIGFRVMERFHQLQLDSILIWVSNQGSKKSMHSLS